MSESYTVKGSLGLWIPVQARSLVKKGVISITESNVLAYVFTMTSDERGCYASNATIANEFGLGGERIRQIIRKLKKIGLLEDVSPGSNRRELVVKFSHLDPRYDPTTPLVSSSQRHSSKYLSNNKSASSDEQPTPVPTKAHTPGHGRFVPPTLEEVRSYCQQKGYKNVDPEAFHAHYESNGWMVGKAKMKNWHAATVTWEKRNEQNGNTNGNGAMKLAGRYVQGPDGRKWLLGQDPGPESGLEARERTILRLGNNPF